MTLKFAKSVKNLKPGKGFILTTMKGIVEQYCSKCDNFLGIEKECPGYSVDIRVEDMGRCLEGKTASECFRSRKK